MPADGVGGALVCLVLVLFEGPPQPRPGLGLPYGLWRWGQTGMHGAHLDSEWHVSCTPASANLRAYSSPSSLSGSNSAVITRAGGRPVRSSASNGEAYGTPAIGRIRQIRISCELVRCPANEIALSEQFVRFCFHLREV